MTRVHTAGFYDHAGFCPDCDAPCCYHYRHVSQSGTATVPRSRQRPGPAAASRRSRRL